MNNDELVKEILELRSLLYKTNSINKELSIDNSKLLNQISELNNELLNKIDVKNTNLMSKIKSFIVKWLPKW